MQAHWVCLVSWLIFRSGTPVVTFIHPGGHEFDPAAPRLIVKFFTEHPAAN